MTRLLTAVVEYLEQNGVKFALIGASAMAMRGSPRATLDLDLLTLSPAVLSRFFWHDLAPSPGPESRHPRSRKTKSRPPAAQSAA